MTVWFEVVAVFVVSFVSMCCFGVILCVGFRAVCCHLLSVVRAVCFYIGGRGRDVVWRSFGLVHGDDNSRRIVARDCY